MTVQNIAHCNTFQWPKPFRQVAEKRNCCRKWTQVFHCSFLNASFIVMNVSNNVSCNRGQDGVQVINHASHLYNQCVGAEFQSIST